jgi:hypothetical protein
MSAERQSCALCAGTGENRTGFTMRVNNHICPRCGGYGSIPGGIDNEAKVGPRDVRYAMCNDIIEAVEHA